MGWLKFHRTRLPSCPKILRFQTRKETEREKDLIKKQFGHFQEHSYMESKAYQSFSKQLQRKHTYPETSTNARKDQNYFVRLIVLIY